MNRRKLSLPLLGLLLTLVCLLGPRPAAASEGTEDLDQALLKARASRKPLVVLLLGGRDTARDAATRTGPGQDWIELLPRHLLRVVVDADKNLSVALRFGASTFPQLIVVDGDGKEVGRIEGGPNAAAQARLERLLHAARQLQRSDRALEENPEDASSLFCVGTHHWNRGDRCAAVQCFRKMVALPSSRDDGAENLLGCALSYLGQYELDRDDPKAAESCFRQAQWRIKDPEGKYRCVFSLAMSLRKQGRSSEATEVLEDYLLQASSSPWAGQALFALGYLKRESGDGEGARRHFQACRDLVPGGLYGERSGRYLDVAGGGNPAPKTPDLARQP